MYICLLRCEGEFYSPCLPKVPGTQWMLSAYLFNEWMKTEKTIRNIQRAVSDGEQITGLTQSEDGDSLGQQILILGGERGSSGRACLPALHLQPAQTLRPWPGNTWLAHRNSKGQVSFSLRYHTETYQLCLLSTGHSRIPPSWFSIIAPVPLCAQERGVSFLLVAFMS